MARRKAPFFGIAIPVLGLAVLAASAGSVSAQNAGPTTPPGGGPGRAGAGMMPGFDLTPRQQTKVGQIVSNAQTQLKAILTPEQLKQWEAMQPRPGGPGGLGGPGGARGFGMLPDSLNLTDDQKAKVQAITQDQMKQFQALGSDTSISQEDRMVKMRAMGQAMQEKIKAVLTPEQQKQLADLQRTAGGPGGFGGPGGQRGFGMLPDSLNLTDDQKAKVQEITQAQMQQFQTLQNDTGLSQQDRMTKMRSMGQAMQEKIKAVLTPDQQKQLAALQPGPGGPGGPGGRGQRGFGMLPDSLNLTDDQKAKVQAITQEMMQQFRALQNDTTLSQEDRMAKMREMGQAMQSKIKEVLTPEQQKQLAATQPGPGMGGRPGSILDALNLTDDQKTKVKAIRKASVTDFRKVLTAEQQKSMDRFPGWADRFPF